MIKFTDYELQQYINEDIPYFDLTTYLQDKKDTKASLSIFTREDIVVSCTEESARIAELLGCSVDFFIPSKQKAKKGDTLISFRGDYNDIHKAWRVCQILLEYSCKITTYSSQMKALIDEVNNHCELLTTRKSFPFAKKFCIKSVMAGDAIPHRLGLSETILIFPQHRIVYESKEIFLEDIKRFKIKAPEKKIVVETESFEDAKSLMENGVDVLQVDKIDVEIVKKIVEYKNTNYPYIKIVVAGGVNIKNVQEYALAGIDGVVSSAMYSCGMVNLGSKMEIL